MVKRELVSLSPAGNYDRPKEKAVELVVQKKLSWNVLGLGALIK